MPSVHLERRMSKFVREPVSVRAAARIIVIVTGVIVVASGILMRVLDSREYGSIWQGMWWALQTVTTVGYGDVTPRDVSGKIVASLVMLEGVALIAIVTAAITSSFVGRAERERVGADTRLDDLAARLDRIESLLRQRD